MTAPDAVVVYSLFGLTLNAIFDLVRTFATLLIVLLAIRIPFKRRYHWMFLVLSCAFLYFSVTQLYSSVASNSNEYLTRTWLINWVNSPVQFLLIYQFVVYFVVSRMTRWQAYVLAGGYVFIAATNWIPLLVDPSFVVTAPHLTPTGLIAGLGTDAPYLVPDNVNLFVTAMAILSFFLLFRYYRSVKSPLVRGQVKYLTMGIALILVGSYVHFISSSYPSLPNLQNLVAGGGDFILLLGLRRKGFYSVTPVAERATPIAQLSYVLEDSHSYLAHDTKVAFEAFSEVVRSGHEGLLITRTFPATVRKDFGVQTTPIRWLAEVSEQDAVSPEDLLGISLLVKDFLQKATKPVVMLHGIEYLTTINGFNPTLRLIQGLIEQNAEARGILLLPLTPKSLDEKDEALLVSETTPFPTLPTTVQ